jgi:hypothetical protein
MEAPEEVSTGESFDVSAKLCCESGLPDHATGCPETKIEVKVEERFDGIFGIWPWFIINGLFYEDVTKLVDGWIEIGGGECREFSEEVTISSPGEYRFVVLLDHRTLEEREIEVS